MQAEAEGKPSALQLVCNRHQKKCSGPQIPDFLRVPLSEEEKQRIMVQDILKGGVPSSFQINDLTS
jgi:hypothetical protein